MANYPSTRKCKHGQTKHGGIATSEYTAWAHMIQRCRNPKNDEFKNYGARGITVDPWWFSFQHFFADMGKKPTPRHTLERKDNERGYSADNCKWATYAEQSRNHRRNRWIEWNGQRKLISDWARELGGSKNTLATRLKRGWTLERAMTTPFC